VQSAEKQRTDINELMRNCAEGYRLAYPEQVFELSIADTQLISNIAPDLFVQMLDKMIANAVDFSSEGKAIELKLMVNKINWQIVVLNYGPALPADMEDQLFNSMVSLREDKSDNDPHLGLGLFIVRLIAEYLGAEVKARNLPGDNGVRFIVEFSI